MATPQPVIVKRRWPKRLQLIGAILAILAAPLLTLSPELCLLAAFPGIVLFVIGRIAE
jgi:hypothetical protein